jgi:PhzF family phenazine biosynthesis protein
MSPTLKLYQADAFTDQPFHGNPACLCILDKPRPETWMQSLAGEMNLSETAFLLEETGGYHLRWFTPKREVNLCGHATLATAHILWTEQYRSIAEEIQFHTKSGLLSARYAAGWIELDFPARLIAPAEPNPALNQALGFTPVATSKNASPQGDYYLLEAASEEIVRNLAPDFDSLARSGLRAVIVTSRAQTPGCDFVSRYFAPGIGVNEDPVTGSAHCYLAPYWGKQLNRSSLTGRQVSARGGVVGCDWRDERVILKGQAVTIFKGELQI